MSKIVISSEAQELPPQQTEAQVLKKKTDEMQANIPETKVDNGKKVLKKDVIKELRERNILFNSRDTLEQLSKQLIDSEIAGGNQE